ncbi:MAG: hypothetical protein K9K39_02385 [Desulfohalobiaceae bacterium]|nr:hypothetical protein [Desulfohalobiaceae bacterium]
MATDNTQLLEDLNRKLDAVVEVSREAKAQGEAIQDLARELSLVSNSAVLSLHDALDLENVHVDGRDVRELMVLTLKNVRNFNAALSQLEAFTELGRETAVTGQKLIMDFSRRVGELEQKGYFEHGQKALQAMDSMLQNLPRDTFERMETAAPELAKLTEELSDPREIVKVRKLVQNRKLLFSGLAAAWLIPVALLVANLFL